MAKQDNYIIVSVESRKGGVGKTTVVLNLAKLLRERYHVLVLDVDVTGTSINAIEGISVWRKSVRLLKDKKRESINLLQFFKEQYLLGRYSMNFSEDGDADSIKIYPDFVNVIGSELYAADGTLLYDPSIIFDEIHDYWLLDMIRGISHSFSEAFTDGKKSVIILDNSPGYVGLGKSIHDLLTDMGPQRGKFLSVSSLDIQDIDSCLKAVKNIETLVQGKEKGATLFHEENPDLAQLKAGCIEQEIFDRLANGDEELSYYSEPNRQHANLDSYQALVLNKVPLNVKNGILVYRYEKSENRVLQEVFTALCGENPQDYMIPYDESIHYQFFKNNLILPKPIEDNKHERLIRQLESLRKRSSKIEMYFQTDEWRRIAYSLNTLNRDLGRLPDSLNEIGLFDQAAHINSAWYPESAFRGAFRCLQDLGVIANNRDFYFPFFLPREFVFERYLNLDFVAQYPKIVCAVKSIFVVFEGFLKQHVDGVPMACEYAMDILKYCLSHESSIEKQAGHFFMNFAMGLRNEAYDPRQLFQVSFLETLARVLDLADDITLLCASISLSREHHGDSETMTDANVSWVLDKKIITKEYSFESAKEVIYRELSDSDYMAIVRQVIAPIISKWGL